MLKLSNICAGYNKNSIINNIDALFPQSSITSIIGPNGSGKSTLLKSIIGLCDINAGTILIDNKNITCDRAIISQSISYMAQSHSAPSLSVERTILHGRFPYLKYPRHYTEDDVELCRKVMKEVGIYDLRHKSAANLSGGELQKVYLAMALVRQCDIYIFDEPNSFLDIKYQLELLDCMKSLRHEGKTVITVLHDLNYAMQISDQIIVMNEGKVTASGTPDEIYDSKIIDKIFDMKCRKAVMEDGAVNYFMTL